jgi:hypothetical protein
MRVERKLESKNGGENEGEGLSNLQEELKSKLLARVKASVKRESEAGANVGVVAAQQIILSFAGKPFNEEEIKKLDVIHALIGNYGYLWIMETARERYEKWLRKRGKDFSETAQRRMLEAHQLIALVEYMSGLVCDAYGVTGTMRGMYRSFALRVMRMATENMPEVWLQRANQIFKEWSLRRELNKEILRTLVLLVLKGLNWYYRTAKKL